MNVNSKLNLTSGDYAGIEVLDSQYNVQSVRTYTEHPYKTNLLARITNWVYELFFGPNAVLVNIADQPPLFVKVSELIKHIPNLAKNIENATDEILANNITQAVKKVFINLKKVELGPEHLSNVITAVKSYIPYQNLSLLINDPSGNFDPEKMLLTISKIGDRINRAAEIDKYSGKKTYGFFINAGKLEISNKDADKRVYVFVDVMTLETVTVPTPPTSPPDTPPTSPPDTPPPPNAVTVAKPLLKPLLKSYSALFRSKETEAILWRTITWGPSASGRKIQHYHEALQALTATQIDGLGDILISFPFEAYLKFIFNVLTTKVKQTAFGSTFSSPLRHCDKVLSNIAQSVLLQMNSANRVDKIHGKDIAVKALTLQMNSHGKIEEIEEEKAV